MLAASAIYWARSTIGSILIPELGQGARRALHRFPIEILASLASLSASSLVKHESSAAVLALKIVILECAGRAVAAARLAPLVGGVEPFSGLAESALS